MMDVPLGWLIKDCEPLAFIGYFIAFVCDSLALVRQPVASICDLRALLSQTLTRTRLKRISSFTFRPFGTILVPRQSNSDALRSQLSRSADAA